MWNTMEMANCVRASKRCSTCGLAYSVYPNM
jgi:hypothetical protein